MIVRALIACASAALMLSACDEEPDSATPPSPSPVSTTPSSAVVMTESPKVRLGPPPKVRPQPGLPKEVADVRARIIGAAREGDYEALRPLVKSRVFLSSYGYGIDPVDRWSASKGNLLELMAVLLKMEYGKQGQNEGVRFIWPVYEVEDPAPALTDEDRRLFRSVMSRKKVQRLFLYEYGYVGPHLGIGTNGRWRWFISKFSP